MAGMLAEDWSPEQIAGHLARTYPAESGMRVSHERIYKSLFIQARGVLAKELTRHLRSGRPHAQEHPQHCQRAVALPDQGRRLDP